MEWRNVKNEVLLGYVSFFLPALLNVKCQELPQGSSINILINNRHLTLTVRFTLTVLLIDISNFNEIT